MNQLMWELVQCIEPSAEPRGHLYNVISFRWIVGDGLPFRVEGLIDKASTEGGHRLGNSNIGG